MNRIKYSKNIFFILLLMFFCSFQIRAEEFPSNKKVLIINSYHKEYFWSDRITEGINCKKVRNDKGYWEQIENYVSNHSEAEFSHTLCRECLNSIYSSISKKIDDKSDSDD